MPASPTPRSCWRRGWGSAAAGPFEQCQGKQRKQPDNPGAIAVDNAGKIDAHPVVDQYPEDDQRNHRPQGVIAKAAVQHDDGESDADEGQPVDDSRPEATIADWLELRRAIRLPDDAAVEQADAGFETHQLPREIRSQ